MTGVPDLVVGGGALAALLTFALAVLKIFSQDKVWRGLNDTLRIELDECRSGREEQRRAHAAERSEWRADRAALEVKVAGLEGELIVLRREVQRDRWLGIDPASRPTEGEPR